MLTRYAYCLFVLLLTTVLSHAATPGDAPGSELLFNGFEDIPAGVITTHNSPSGHWESVAGTARFQSGHRRTGSGSLRLEGDRSVIVWTPAVVEHEPYQLSFWVERWSSQGPFGFTVETFDGESWHEVYRGDDTIRTGGFHTQVTLPLNGVMPKQLRFTCTSEPGKGVLIDDVRVTRFLPMSVRSVTVEPTGMPVLIGNTHNPVSRIVIDSPGSAEPLSLHGVTLSFKSAQHFEGIQAVEVYCTGAQPMLSWRDPGSAFDGATPMGEPQTPAATMTFSGDIPLADGNNHLWISYRLLPGADRMRIPTPNCESLTIAGHDYYADSYTSEQSETLQPQRTGVALRNPGDDGVTSYRIPGMATTNSGTLIAVYDVRHDGWGDLPGNIDIGMNRSTDGGMTWEPMKIIADMGDDPAWAYDGVGDPAILVDTQTGTIWVAGLWSHGQRGWRGSEPGLTPEQTGQLLLFKSDDDGVTWSDAINITTQVKNPDWRLMFQGPGSGITMRDGTLVFAAQFKDADDMPYATIITSRDHGKTWQCGSGAKSNTTEAQVVELADGSLMLNMRDNRGGSRSICVTRDLGETWTEHASSRSALPEPVCQASLIRVDVEGYDQPVLLFSNPAVPDRPRRHMTIKASFDGGVTWPEDNHLLIDAGECAGYSSLTMIDKDTIGILYEGSRANMTFMRIPLTDVLGTSNKAGK